MDRFQPYSLQHALVLIALALSTLLLIKLGRRQQCPQAPTQLEALLGWGNLLLWAAANGRGFLPERFDPAKSLPLQMCDLTSLLVSLVLLTRWRPSRSLLYFWGLGLSTQALLTPDLAEGPATLAFWLFWLNHGAIIAAAFYDIAVNGFRPGWRDYRLAVVASLGYLAVVLPLNVAFGMNYGYVGASLPGQPSILDLLGPWPERIAIIVLLVWLAMTLMVLPWIVARRRGVG